jgi:hypothetical protein
MPRSSRESESGPLTLGQARAAQVRLIVWCKSCGHWSEPDTATQVAQHGAEMPVIDWARLLRCTECGVRDADFVVTGSGADRGKSRPSGNAELSKTLNQFAR